MWQIANVRGIRARGRRRNSSPDEKARSRAQRSSDVKNLTRQEQKLLAESKHMLALGKIIPAARILEQLNMPREAIQMLEDNGLIHDAAGILMRMQRSNRAGVIYARHGMWEQAAQCFKMANMPLEVAKCSRELGQMEIAGEYYEMANRWAEAADCFEHAGSFRRAAKLFGQAELPQRQITMYQKLASSGAPLHTIDLDDHEMQQIVDYLCKDPVDLNLAAVLGRRGRLPEVILRLAAQSKYREAADYLKHSAADLGPQLIAAVNYQDASAPALAELFTSVAKYGYAGMVYERLNAFDRAALAFEKADDLARAAYCYERAGRTAEAQMLRNKGKPATLPQVKSAPGRAPSFSLEDSSLGAGDDGEKTTVIGAPAEAMNATGSDAADETATEAHALPSKAAFAMVKSSIASVAKAAPNQVAAATQDKSPPPLAASLRADVGVNALNKITFCADLDAAQRDKLWAIRTMLNFSTDDTILTYDGDPRGIYIILQGSVSCYRKAGGKELYVDQMGAFECFGELWLLADQPTAVRFVATKPTEICLIERTAFINLLDNDGAVARKLYKRFTMRLLNRLLKANNPNKSGLAS